MPLRWCVKAPLRLRIIFAASSNSVHTPRLSQRFVSAGSSAAWDGVEIQPIWSESHWSCHMLNPWLAITFQAIRLGFEAQNAMALRMMRLVGDVSKRCAGGMIADKGPPPADAQKAANKVASRSRGRRETVSRVHKKRVSAKRPGSRITSK